MSRVSASLRLRHTALAICLCLLAVVFAVEAKLAWYSPAGTHESEIRAAKAWPADTSEIIVQNAQAFQATCFLIPLGLLAVSSAAFKAPTNFSTIKSLVQPAQAVAAAPFFTPHFFFRPPPTR